MSDVRFNGPRGMTVEERFWPKVDRRGDDECWLWLAAVDHQGYGRFWIDGHQPSAHRVSFALAHGWPPAGMVVDHECRVRHCVNPRHLRLLTPGDNTRVGYAVNISASMAWDRDSCKHGHLYTEASTRWAKSASGRPTRQCRTCAAAYQRRRRAERATP